MPSLIDIRRRIRAVKSTQQITKAMKMIAASRLRKAHDRIIAARPFSHAMVRVLYSLAGRVDAAAHPLLAARDDRQARRARAAARRHGRQGAGRRLQRERDPRGGQFILDRRGQRVSLGLVGRKGRDFFRRRLVPGAARAHEPVRAARFQRRDEHRGADHRRLRRRRDRRGLHRLQRVQVDDRAACRHRAAAAGAAPGRGPRRARADGRQPGLQPRSRPRRPHRRGIADRLPVRAGRRSASSKRCSRGTCSTRSSTRCSSRRPPSTPRA